MTSERRWRRDGGKKIADAPLSLIARLVEGWIETAMVKAEERERDHFLSCRSFSRVFSMAALSMAS